MEIEKKDVLNYADFIKSYKSGDKFFIKDGNLCISFKGIDRPQSVGNYEKILLFMIDNEDGGQSFYLNKILKFVRLVHGYRSNGKNFINWYWAAEAVANILDKHENEMTTRRQKIVSDLQKSLEDKIC